MEVIVCPRCRRTNPGAAVFCYFDGAELRPHVDGVGAPVYNRLLKEFEFPSGRRCRTFDELAQGCASTAMIYVMHVSATQAIAAHEGSSAR